MHPNSMTSEVIYAGKAALKVSCHLQTTLLGCLGPTLSEWMDECGVFHPTATFLLLPLPGVTQQCGRQKQASIRSGPPPPPPPTAYPSSDKWREPPHPSVTAEVKSSSRAPRSSAQFRGTTEEEMVNKNNQWLCYKNEWGRKKRKGRGGITARKR